MSIGSTGHKNMYIGVGLGGSALDAKGGIVGGAVELNKIDTFVHIREEPGVEPHHTVGIKLMALELRLDYMGTSVLMTRISALNATLRDEWKCSKDAPNKAGGRPTIILIHGDLSWDQLQIMISKSTTADLLKMFYKLEEFFSQQFKSSKRVFSSLEPRLGQNRHSNSMSRKQKKVSAAHGQDYQPKDNYLLDAKHHRHWQKPLRQAMGLILSTLSEPLPKSGTVLGGTMELHGLNISLACFHGINFKAKSWALFSLRDPCINFATEAQQVNSSQEVHVVQTLTFGLGMNTTATTQQNHSMATVCRMSRTIIFPPQFKTLHEWFHYAFANSEIDGWSLGQRSLHRQKINFFFLRFRSGSISGVGTRQRAEHEFHRTGSIAVVVWTEQCQTARPQSQPRSGIRFAQLTAALQNRTSARTEYAGIDWYLWFSVLI